MQLPESKNIAASFTDDRHAARAIRALTSAGFDVRRMSAFHPKTSSVRMAARGPFDGLRDSRDVGYGWLIGSLVGALVGGLGILSLGAATLASVLFAVATGAGFGAAIGIAVAPWVPQGTATEVVAAVPTGECVVSVEASGEAEIEDAKRALMRAGASSVLMSHSAQVPHHKWLAFMS